MPVSCSCSFPARFSRMLARITVVTQGPNDKSSISTLAFKAVATREKALANLELSFNFHLEVFYIILFYWPMKVISPSLFPNKQEFIIFNLMFISKYKTDNIQSPALPNAWLLSRSATQRETYHCPLFQLQFRDFAQEEKWAIEQRTEALPMEDFICITVGESSNLRMHSKTMQLWLKY